MPLKWISLFLLAILPIFEVPNWCIRDNLYTKGFSKTECDPENYPNSNFVKFPPAFTTFLTLLAYCLLSIFVVMRLFIKKKTKSAIIRSSIMMLMMLISSIDLIWVFSDNNRSTTPIVNIFNVCLLLFFVRAIREVWIQFMQVVMFSVPVFVIIFAYFVIFILVGFIFFANSTASESFTSINESMYTVFILFTVSNYPDVQMPYFADNRLTFIYFWIFLLVGIFLLSNLLLA